MIPLKEVLCFLICITFLKAATAQEYLPPACKGPKQELIPFLKGKKWGYCNRDKKLVIPAVYDEAAAFGAVPLNAEKLHYPEPDVAYVRKGREELWINAKGETWPVTGGRVRENSGQLIEKALEMVWEANYTANGKQGFILKGDTVIPAVYDEVQHLPNGDFYLKLENKAGVMDSSKNWIVPLEFEEIDQIRLNNEHHPVYSRGYKVMKGGRWGLYVKGNPVMPVKYREIQIMDVWSFDWYKAQHEDGSWCLLDGNGKRMGGVYEELGPYSAIVDRMAVKSKGKWGFADSKGILRIACKYSEAVEYHYVNGLALVKNGNRSYYIDCNGVEYCSN